MPSLRHTLLTAVVATIGFVAGTGAAAGAQAPPPATSAWCRGHEATLVATPGAVTTGTDGDDVIVGTTGADTIIGGGGDDIICAGGGDDIVAAGRGADRVFAGAGDDAVRGGGGNDRLHAGPGRDRTSGGPGRDRADGGAGNDRCAGGAGLDRNTACERLPRPNQRPAVHAIGDSVMLGATDAHCGALSRAVPGLVEDAEVSRSFLTGPDLVSTARRSTAGEMVFVIGLGTNGPFSPDTLDALIAAGGRNTRFVFVNTRVPRSWEAEVNLTITDGVARHARRATLVDWHTLAAATPGATGGDGIHLTCDGAAIYARAVADGLLPWS